MIFSGGKNFFRRLELKTFPLVKAKWQSHVDWPLSKGKGGIILHMATAWWLALWLGKRWKTPAFFTCVCETLSGGTQKKLALLSFYFVSPFFIRTFRGEMANVGRNKCKAY